MSSRAIPGRVRPRLNFTEISTAMLLAGASATCTLLWIIIVSTVTG